VLLLSNDDVQVVLQMSDCLAVLRRFFEEDASGRVLTRQRTESWLPHERPQTFYQCKTMEGGVPYLEKYAVRIDSNITQEKQLGEISRTEHLALVGGNWMGMLLVFSTATGELLGWMPDGYLQRTRVGALYALAGDYLARSDATDIGLIGSGWQAGGQILGLCCVRNIQRVRVYSPSPANRVRFAAEMEQCLGIEVRPVGTAREAIANADIVALATNAGQKVIEADWVEKGQHINSVRFRELDPLLYERCDRVVVNRAEPWIRNYFLSELCPRDVTDATLPAAPSALEAHEFFARKLKRTGRMEITLFPNEASNYQLGGQFAAVAGYVLEKALEKGLGRELPSEWFSQKLPP
jgi:alanine dehydrogenase